MISLKTHVHDSIFLKYLTLILLSKLTLKLVTNKYLWLYLFSNTFKSTSFRLTCHRSCSLDPRSPGRSPSTPPCSLLLGSAMTSRRARRNPAAAGPRSPSSWRCCPARRSATRCEPRFAGKWGSWRRCRWWAGASRRRSCGAWSCEEESPAAGAARCSASALIETLSFKCTLLWNFSHKTAHIVH